MGEPDVEFCLLGPLIVRSKGAALPILPGKQRVLLAALLLKPNNAVPLDELVEAIWADDPPPSAHSSIRNFVKALRRALGEAFGSRIGTVPGGYTISVGSGELDVAQFTGLTDRARSLSDDGAWEEAAVALREALSLWRSEPLADVPSQWLAMREVPRLTELRLRAFEARCEAELQLARPGELIADLRQMIALHPLRERLHALLMLSLYRDGQQAASLAAYQHARAVLVEELATEPGPELEELQQRVLAADPALMGPTSLSANRAVTAHVVPRELPAPVGHFTGRSSELDEMSDLADAPRRALVICAVGGTAGVGKTALAVQWAHLVAERFPDGQLYVNLRGYDPGEPMSAADALAGFLRALGVSGTDIPDEMQERARLYRTRLAGRRVLVLLDNARDADQVRPLLPGDPACVAVVTSRDTLGGLVATDGARRIDLDVLPLSDAVALLRSLIGPRADAEQSAVATLAELCARLPLALRIAAELAAARYTVPLADLVTELAADRLDGFDAGEDRADARAVFSWSIRHLPDDAARAFALIGLHPGSALDVHAAAALTGATTGQARRVLSRLLRASLVHACGPGRFGMHDLLRAYARELAAACDGDGQRHQALTRLFDYYLSAAAAAMDVLYPDETQLRPHVQQSAVAGPAMPSEAEARAWLDRERANLVALVVHCTGHGWPAHATSLASTLFRYLLHGSHLTEAYTIYNHAVNAAGRSGDTAAQAEALNGLGGVGTMRGHFRDAVGHYQAALERYRQCGNRAGQARVLHSLGHAEFELRNPQSAAGYYRQAIAAFEDIGDSVGAARGMAHLASAETDLGCFDQAAEHLQRALPVLRNAEYQLGAADALATSGWLSLRRGQLTQAAGFYQQAMAICRRIGHPTGVATQLGNLGEVSVRQGEYQQAIRYLRQALAMFRATGYQHGEILTLRSLAEALHAGGRPAAARAELVAALRLAAETGNTSQQAGAHCDLAESHYHAGQDEQARHHWQQALALYVQLDAPEAGHVRSRLSAQRPSAG